MISSRRTKVLSQYTHSTLLTFGVKWYHVNWFRGDAPETPAALLLRLR